MTVAPGSKFRDICLEVMRGWGWWWRGGGGLL